MQVPLPWLELVRRAVRSAIDDDVPGQAAQLAYYLFLALFPALLFLLALASFFPLHLATDALAESLAPVVSPQVLELVLEQMRRLADRDDGGLLTLGVAGALWSSSAGMASMANALNRAYGITERRPWWKVRLTAIGLTVSVTGLVVLAWATILLGPPSARWLAEAGFGPLAVWGWRLGQGPLVFGVVTLAITVVYHVAPDIDRKWTWITPGAIVATLLWLVASLGFRVYVANFTDYTGAYGAVGGAIVLLLWFYVSSLAILAGAELDAEIEQARESSASAGRSGG